jgi:hypothetical protein
MHSSNAVNICDLAGYSRCLALVARASYLAPYFAHAFRLGIVGCVAFVDPGKRASSLLPARGVALHLSDLRCHVNCIISFDNKETCGLRAPLP